MAAAALCLAAFSNGQVDPNRTIATINGEAIKGLEYYHRMEFLPGVTKRYGGQAIESPPGFLTVVELIGEKLLLQLAKEKGVMPASVFFASWSRTNIASSASSTSRVRWS